MALFRNLHEKNLMFRGFVLDSTIEIERKMDIVLSIYFCDSEEKRILIRELLFYTEPISFNVKKELLITIISNTYQDFFTQNKTFKGDLDKIQSERNTFAHSELDLNEKENLVFKKYKKGALVFKIYTRKDFAILEDKIYRVQEQLDKLIIKFSS